MFEKWGKQGELPEQSQHLCLDVRLLLNWKIDQQGCGAQSDITGGGFPNFLKKRGKKKKPGTLCSIQSSLGGQGTLHQGFALNGTSEIKITSTSPQVVLEVCSPFVSFEAANETLPPSPLPMDVYHT